VADGGVLVIAIYVKTRFCGMWKTVKRSYCRSPRLVQQAMIHLFHLLRSFRQIFNGEIFRDYTTLRGMSRFHDSIDWLGGYPYESASQEEIVERLTKDFTLVKSFSTKPGNGLLGTGCAEYVFLKKNG
jgi:2-polyprenyl-6-hydroxyphenyl methylase/3-demethylubiquinone-9 3-methyltransferase